MFCSFPALQPPSVTTFTAKVTQAQGTWASPALAVRPHLALREDLLGSLRVCDTSRITAMVHLQVPCDGNLRDTLGMFAIELFRN